MLVTHSYGDVNFTPDLCVNDGFDSNEPQNVGPEVIETEIITVTL